MNPDSQIEAVTASNPPHRPGRKSAPSGKSRQPTVGDRAAMADHGPRDVRIDGEPYLCIRHVDRLPPFLMSVVANGDGWLFVGSNGGFTAGRGNPDRAIFPYQTADRILDQPQTAGVMTVILAEGAAWTPWGPSPASPEVSRHLYKHTLGTKVIFEEIHERLGLRLRWSLESCGRFGLVRSCTLDNLLDRSLTLRMLDGWHHLLPAGVGQETHARFSYLAAAYMRHEAMPGTGLGIYTLNSGITDRAEPSESLRATCAWTLGHTDPVLLLSDRQVDAFRRGQPVTAETEVRGEFGAHLVATEFTLPPGGDHTWWTVADGSLDQTAVAALQYQLGSPERLLESLRADLTANRDGLKRRIAAADGLQQTADSFASIHHFANVLFNCMRGGTPEDGYHFPRADFISYLQARNPAILARHREWVDALPDRATLSELAGLAHGSGDPQLVRLVREYLPLSFSRRHGDPSRPWNRFEIRTTDHAGQPVFGYSGNWRDIFQNWEALAYSYPLCFGSMIAVFLNASTADGYNPYRITRDGIDWEVHDPKDPWSHIGYWGDHQLVYLLRLLEGHERFLPGALADALNDRHYAYATVPYEIRSLDALLRDPRHSIDFNSALHEELIDRAARNGGDGKLLADSDGEVERVTLAEKLLVPLLVKLSNLVPGGGIWLNTQRPEWNDANNALAGWGLSVVTVCYLRRYLVFLQQLLAACPYEALEISVPNIGLLEKLTEILPVAAGPLDDAARREWLVAAGRAGEQHRARVYERKPFPKGHLTVVRCQQFAAAALQAVDGTLAANRRDDGMFHSYNLLTLAPGSAAVGHLQLMLEGQVAALSSGLLDASQASALLAALRRSALYRDDQHSYLLYPDKPIVPFLERNILPAGWKTRAPLLAMPATAGCPPIVGVDGDGRARFNADLTNERDLRDLLDRIARDPDRQVVVNRDRDAILTLWEEVFHHHAFTGRSGAMFAFEGLGSIYWHMIAKLLLAVQELHTREFLRDPNSAAARQLADDYAAIRLGLGFTKDARTYGAFPTDPYSHTPRHRGAQQPGMTGQVKEEILTRLGELGVFVTGGLVSFEPALLNRAEFFDCPHCFEYIDIGGTVRTWQLGPQTLAFTLCQVPVCYLLGGQPSITVEWDDGTTTTQAGSVLPPGPSRELFARSGRIRRLIVTLSNDRIPL